MNKVLIRPGLFTVVPDRSDDELLGSRFRPIYQSLKDRFWNSNLGRLPASTSHCHQYRRGCDSAAIY